MIIQRKKMLKNMVIISRKRYPNLAIKTRPDMKYKIPL
jgi:hypothetical protein